ncbi:MAG: PSD1 and planctomycete cytochrome C domain-containing protein [Planctomycetaceae bacterium]|nr:PSD1 and planctomycete cytochrome C domain-containing protein [Planctomycetaceae bacterium]
MKRLLPLLLLAVSCAFCSLCSAEDISAGEKLFALKLKPLFTQKCLACHGDDPTDIAAGFDMRTRDSLLAGGESFGDAVVVHGKGTESYLYLVTTREEEGYEMPPKESERLTEEQTWWIRDWINDGAPWPGEQKIAAIVEEYAEGEQVATSGGLGEDWTGRRYKSADLWAYRPPQFSVPPEVIHPVDWFINRGLQQRQLNAAGTAETTELLRRLSFGLTGLPPGGTGCDQAERAFVNHYPATPAKAVQQYADALMQTPHYGEHFARQWLDVVRYADSAGFANDYARPNAWRYRDYVVRSFNEDKPYDQFAKEQIAGDEMDWDNPEHRIATGFLRMGPWEQTGMSVFRVTRQQWLDDVTDSVGQTFLAHAMQCCKCHDHKFDPLPTRDYYSMMAVFSTTQFGEPNTPFLPTENQARFAESEQWTKAKIASYNQQRKDLQFRVAQARKSEDGDAKTGDNGLDPGDEASLARMGKNISRHTWELDKTRPIAFSVFTGKTIERKNVANRLLVPTNRWAKGYIEQDTILTGGDAYTRGAAVTPGALSAAESLGKMPPLSFPDGQGKRRLALAEWIVHPSNPLTARVIVNRVWSWHFGTGLAGNPNNFGATGKPPTHPELLDYLANRFMQDGWSIRKLNQLIVTSVAYRRSTRHPNPADFASKDPRNEAYATFRPRRLTAEELRDAMLAVSGELNPEIGGIPCRPDINLEVAMQPRQIMGGTASVYEPDPLPTQRNRRTLYAEKIRGLRDPFMEAFNQPGPDKSCELRETSTVAPQALTLFNSTEVQDRALGLAVRLLAAQQKDSQTIDQLFQRALARPPSPAESQACLDHWHTSTTREQGKTYEPIALPAEITRTVMAEKTGEPYNFIEVMPAYQNYTPDTQPSDVSPRTRGLAQVCLVLFNLNEFAYLD